MRHARPYCGICRDFPDIAAVRCVHFQVGTECLAVLALFRSTYSMVFRPAGWPFLCREYMPVCFRRNDRHLALAEISGVRSVRPARIHVQFDEGRGELFPLRLSMFSRKTGCLRSASLSSKSVARADFFGILYYPVLRLACILRPAGHLVQRDERGRNSAPSVRFMSSTGWYVLR